MPRPTHDADDGRLQRQADKTGVAALSDAPSVARDVTQALIDGEEVVAAVADPRSAALRPGDPLPWAPAYVRTACGHSTPASEWEAGFTTCETCPRPYRQAAAGPADYDCSGQIVAGDPSRVPLGGQPPHPHGPGAAYDAEGRWVAGPPLPVLPAKWTETEGRAADLGRIAARMLGVTVADNEIRIRMRVARAGRRVLDVYPLGGGRPARLTETDRRWEIAIPGLSEPLHATTFPAAVALVDASEALTVDGFITLAWVTGAGDVVAGDVDDFAAELRMVDELEYAALRGVDVSATKAPTAVYSPERTGRLAERRVAVIRSRRAGPTGWVERVRVCVDLGEVIVEGVYHLDLPSA